MQSSCACLLRLHTDADVPNIGETISGTSREGKKNRPVSKLLAAAEISLDPKWIGRSTEMDFRWKGLFCAACLVRKHQATITGRAMI
jgi:hypothetical protein